MLRRPVCSRPAVVRSTPRRFAPRAATGFSLLEVLVAIVVLSFGVLGVVGLQAAALQANKEARFQSAGVRLARELSDLMRGNYAAAGAAGNAYLAASTAAAPGTPPEDCYTMNCSSADNIAKFQKFEWLQRLADELPGAKSEVCFDATPYNDTTGKPQWGCTGTGNVVYIKIGWDRQSVNRAASGVDAATTAPTVVMPVIPN